MGALDGRIALITGGGRGIGAAIATRFAAEGATIVISSRTESDLLDTLARSGAGDDRGLAVVAEAIDRFGRVDILVNNVGGTIGGNTDPFAANDTAFEQTLVLSLISAWWTTSA